MLPAAFIGRPKLYTNTVQTPERLFGVKGIFRFFPLKASNLGRHQTSFWPVEALGFSERKTPLVYTFAPLFLVIFYQEGCLVGVSSSRTSALQLAPPDLQSSVAAYDIATSVQQAGNMQ